MTAAVAAGVLGMLVGLALDRWLRRRTYRYEDEAGLPPRPTGWVVPAVTVAAALVAAGQVEPHPALGLLLVLATPWLVGLAAIDIDTHRLPDRWVVPGGVGALAGLGVVAVVDGSLHPVTAGALAGLALGAFYLVSVVVGDLLGSGMGLGDAKLAVVLGLLLGPLSGMHVVVATVLAFVTAAVQGAWMVLRHGASRRTHLAFGPHMVLGALLVLAPPGVGVLLRGGS